MGYLDPELPNPFSKEAKERNKKYWEDEQAKYEAEKNKPRGLKLAKIKAKKAAMNFLELTIALLMMALFIYVMYLMLASPYNGSPERLKLEH